MKQPIAIYFTALTCVLSCIHPTAAETSRLLPFQGRLTDSGGNPISDGTKVLQFKIYDASTGGSVLWGGELQILTVNGGLVNTLLGTGASLSQVDFNRPLFLEITVDADNDGQITLADPPLLPRQSILPSVFALESAVSRSVVNGAITSEKLAPNTVTANHIAEGAVSKAAIAKGSVTELSIEQKAVTLEKLAEQVIEKLVPVGSVCAYAGSANKIPNGWLLCDGSSVSRTDYPQLFETIGVAHGYPDAGHFNLPDYRGMFLRGLISNLQITCSGAATNNAVSTSSPHPFTRSGMRVRVTGVVPSGLNANSFYFITRVSDSQLSFASSSTDAINGKIIEISGDATGLVITQAQDPDVLTRTPMNSGGNAGSAIGSVQAQGTNRNSLSIIDPEHNHTFQPFNGRGPQGAAHWGARAGGDDGPQAATHGHKSNTSLSEGDSETRPLNAVVNYIIKY